MRKRRRRAGDSGCDDDAGGDGGGSGDGGSGDDGGGDDDNDDNDDADDGDDAGDAGGPCGSSLLTAALSISSGAQRPKSSTVFSKVIPQTVLACTDGDLTGFLVPWNS